MALNDGLGAGTEPGAFTTLSSNSTTQLGDEATDTITQYGNLTTGANCSCDWSGSSGTFKTPTGTHTIGGDVNVTAGKDVVTSGAGYFQGANLQITNIKANDGTACASIADSTGVMTTTTKSVFSAGFTVNASSEFGSDHSLTFTDNGRIYWYDTDMYMRASGDGSLETVSDTLYTITSPTTTIASSTMINLDGDTTLTGALIIDGTAGYGIDLDSATISTADVRLSGGALLENMTPGELNITETAISLTGSVAITGDTGITGVLDVGDVSSGGSATGSIIKKTLQAGEDYTTTTAGLMVKNYGDATATVSSGEFTGLYVNLKGLHTDPGHNTSLISAHVHSSNTTTVWAGLWLYGDMTNGVKASGSSLTNMIDISEATAVTNVFAFPAEGTAPVGTSAPSGASKYVDCTVGGVAARMLVQLVS